MDIQNTNTYDGGNLSSQMSNSDNRTARAAIAQMPPVNEAANQLENNINDVFEWIARLEDRLESTLAPRSPTKEQDEKKSVKPRAGSSPLFGHLYNCNERMLQLCERLQEICRRIEV